METGTAATTQEPQKASRWEDYIDVFFSPTELFQRRAQDRVLPPLLTLIGLALLFYFLLLPSNQIVMRASITDPEQMQAMERMGTFFSIIGSIGIPVVYILFTVGAAFLLWLGGRFADIRTEFGRAMLIATYAGFIMLLSQVLASVLILVLGESGFHPVRSMSFGPLRFVGERDMNPFMTALLGRFDIFALWQAFVWAVGIAVIYKTTMKRAAVVAGITWFLFFIPNLIGAMMAQMGPAGP